MQKFSFISDVIYFQNGQEVEIHSKVPFDYEVTVQISSSYSDLNNKVFQTEPNSSLLFKYKPRTNGFIKATRVWGTVWDFNGFLDIDFKHIATKDNVVEIAEQTAIELGTSSPITRTIYDYQGWTNIEIFKSVSLTDLHFDFWLSEHNGASYSIVSNDKDFVVENPFLFFTGNISQYVQITQDDLKKIGVCLKIFFGGSIYDLQGAQNINELEQELYLIFSENSKIQIYRQADNILIYSDYTDRNKMKFQGVNKSFSKIFQGYRRDKKLVRIKLLNKDWSYKRVEFDIITNGLVRRPKMIVHFENKDLLEYDFELENDSLTVGEMTKLYLNSSHPFDTQFFLQINGNVSCDNRFSIQEESNRIFWYVEPLTNENVTFSIKDVISETFSVNDKPEYLDLLHSLQITKEEIILTIYLSKPVDYNYDYEIYFQDKLSKENIDYRLATKYHNINIGQLDRKEKITWTTAQTIRSFDIILDGKIIPVFWYDKTYYPNNIAFRNNNNVKHFINRSVSRPLTLQYFDGVKSGKLSLAPGATDWQYEASNNSVHWKIFDQEYLIHEQRVTYVKEVDRKPYLRMMFDDSLNSKSINYLTLKLDWPVKYDVDFDLVVNSNTDIKISGKYRMKADQTEMKFRLTPLRLKNKPSFVSLQIASANVDYDNRKYNLIIN